MHRFLKLLPFLLLLHAAPLAAQWHRATSPHFDIYAEGGAAEVRERAERLERLDAALRLIAGMEAGRETRPLTIFFLRNVSAVQRAYGGAAVGAFGFYAPRAGGAMAVTPLRTPPTGPGAMTAENVLFHEYTHHFLLQNFTAAYPPWFVEGFAEFYATANIAPDGSVTIGSVPLFRAQSLRASADITAEQLLTTGTLDLRRRDLVGFYSRSWLLVHYLTFNQARTGQRARYIAAIERGLSLESAAREAFGDLNALNAELRRYVDSPLATATVRASALPVPPITVTPMTAAEIALVPLRMQHMRGILPERSADFVSEVRALARAHPDDPQLLYLLAEAEAMAGDRQASERAADAVLARAPNHSRALLRKARNMEAQGGPDALRSARSLIVRANRSDPRDPLPMLAYYRSFLLAGQEPPQVAVEGLLLAAQLAPQSTDARLAAAAALVRAGRGAEAVPLLRPAAYAPHGGSGAEQAQELIRLIEAGGPAALRAAADRILADRLD